MRLELLDGRAFDLDIKPCGPFEEKCGGCTTSIHVSFHCKTLASHIVDLPWESMLEDVQLWDGDQLVFRGDALITQFRHVNNNVYFLLNALPPFWHTQMKAH